jgi:hypothetical protein
MLPLEYHGRTDRRNLHRNSLGILGRTIQASAFFFLLSFASLSWQAGTFGQVAGFSLLLSVRDACLRRLPTIFTGSVYQEGYDSPLPFISQDVAETVIEETLRIHQFKERSQRLETTVQTLQHLTTAYAELASELDGARHISLQALKHSTWMNYAIQSLDASLYEYERKANAYTFISWFIYSEQHHHYASLANTYRQQLAALKQGDIGSILSAYKLGAPVHEDAIQRLELSTKSLLSQIQQEWESGYYSIRIQFKNNLLRIENGETQAAYDMRRYEEYLEPILAPFPSALKEFIISSIQYRAIQHRHAAAEAALAAEQGREQYKLFRKHIQEEQSRIRTIQETAFTFSKNCRENPLFHTQCFLSTKLEAELGLILADLTARDFILPEFLFETIIRSLQRKGGHSLTPRDLVRILAVKRLEQSPNIAANIAIMTSFIAVACFTVSLTYGIAWILHAGLLGTTINLVGILHETTFAMKEYVGLCADKWSFQRRIQNAKCGETDLLLRSKPDSLLSS